MLLKCRQSKKGSLPTDQSCKGGPLQNFIGPVEVLEDGSSLLRNPELEDAFFFWIFGHLLKFLFPIIVVELILEAE